MDVTCATFQSVGTTPSFKDLLNIILRGNANISDSSLTTFGYILSGPQALFGFSNFIFFNSVSSVICIFTRGLSPEYICSGVGSLFRSSTVKTDVNCALRISTIFQQSVCKVPFSSLRGPTLDLAFV